MSTAGVTRQGLRILGVGIASQRALFSLAVLGSLVYGGLTVADAWVLGWATDHVITPSFAAGHLSLGAAVAVAGLFLSVALLRALGVIGRRLIGGTVYFRLLAEYRRRVTRQYLALPLRWHQRHPTGQLLSNANADVEAVWAAMMPLPMAVGVLAMLLIGVVAMLTADPVLTLVGLVVFPMLFAINVGYQRYLSPRITRAQQLRGTVSAVAHESFDGALVVKALGREAEETARFAAVSDELRAANVAAGSIRSLFDPVLEALPNLGVLLVVLFGAQRVGSGAAAPGDVVQVAYLFIVIGFPVRAFGWVLGELPRTVVGWDRVRAVLDATGSMTYGHEQLPGTAPVQLEVADVTFGYDGAPPVLRDVSFDVAPGHTVAVVGRTGSGKSTLAALLGRLMDPDDGSVCLNGYDLRRLEHESLAGAVALVGQSAFIFDDSVRGNVTLGGEFADEAVVDALAVAAADEFVAALPDGLDTELGERGATLSGGQRQRVALARALVRRPRLLLLDDATSAVDPEVEARILAALRRRTRIAGGPTVLVIAYRKASIALADEVVFLADGRVADRGTHTELSVRCAAYRNIVDAYDPAGDAVSSTRADSGAA